MIKIEKFSGSRGLKRLENTLNKRRSSQNSNIPIVSKILKDIRVIIPLFENSSTIS